MIVHESLIDISLKPICDKRISGKKCGEKIDNSDYVICDECFKIITRNSVDDVKFSDANEFQGISKTKVKFKYGLNGKIGWEIQNVSGDAEEVEKLMIGAVNAHLEGLKQMEKKK